MKYRCCDICGTVLNCAEILFDIKDAADPYIKYHSTHGNVCYDCYSELMTKHNAAVAEAKASCSCGCSSSSSSSSSSDSESTDTSTSDGCGCTSMTEF